MMRTSLDDCLSDVLALGASDLHLAVGLPPIARVDGRVLPLGYPALTSNVTREMVYGVLSADQRRLLEDEWELDFAYSLPRKARFRVNVFFQRGSLGAAFRTIPLEVRSMCDLGLPRAVEDLTDKPRGLVLVTGPTGSGKSTTLASMVDRINEARCEHIVIIEDPIEFLHGHKKCMVNQREVGQDTRS
ncbi:MAG: type IV pilus twitching motility protein PilT, partial [Rubrobacter sp.]